MTWMINATEDEGELHFTVDNRKAADRTCGPARSRSRRAGVTEDDDAHHITIAQEESEPTGSPEGEPLVILFESDVMGSDVELGRILIRSYIHALADGEPVPRSMIFVNTGVYLTSEGSAVLDDLLCLQERGVQILSCGTCLDFFQLKDDLKAGQITNMYTIAETLARADRVVTL